MKNNRGRDSQARVINVVNITETLAYKKRQEHLRLARMSVLEMGERVVITGCRDNSDLEFLIGQRASIIGRSGGKQRDGSVDYIVKLDRDEILTIINSIDLDIVDED